jgi:hypothetical protein
VPKPAITLVFLILIFTASIACQAQTSPLLIAWQAPAPQGTAGWSLAYNSNTYSSQCNGTSPPVTQYICFLSNVLPNISGIGVVVPWAGIDNCGSLSNPIQCSADDQNCTLSATCFNWSWLDTPLMTYLSATTGTGNFSSNGCAGGRPCKIVLIVWLTADTGNENLYTGAPYSIPSAFPNTPTYVFAQNWANTAGWANPASGCIPPSNCGPQDVLVCQQHHGGSAGWPIAPPMIDLFTPGTSCAGDVGLWNTQTTNILKGSCWTSVVAPNTNFSGYPVMYENPIYYAARNFIRALSVHYSSSCNYPHGACGNGPTIAQSIAYVRIGPSGGGENYPACACISSSGGSQCNTFYWPGPQGFNPTAPTYYSDQGYLTTWPSASGGGTGYVASLYQYMHSLSWAFPIDSPMEHGPPQNMNYVYPDTEAFLANQNGLGIGMQALNIGDSVTYAANTFDFFPGFVLPSTVEDWAVNFREFPNVPVHHLQTEQPGSPSAARFTISSTGITITTLGCTSSSCPSATINCTLDCSAYCLVAPWVYVSGNSNSALNGIQQVDINSLACTSSSPTTTIGLTGSFPPTPGAAYSGGYVFSGVHLPVLLPFATQQCQGSLQTICSVEIWEELLDWAYGTNTVSGTSGDTSSGDSTYQTAIQNFLAGLPNVTSFHSHMSTNANQY